MSTTQQNSTTEQTTTTATANPNRLVNAAASLRTAKICGAGCGKQYLPVSGMADDGFCAGCSKQRAPKHRGTGGGSKMEFANRNRTKTSESSKKRNREAQTKAKLEATKKDAQPKPATNAKKNEDNKSSNKKNRKH